MFEQWNSRLFIGEKPKSYEHFNELLEKFYCPSEYGALHEVMVNGKDPSFVLNKMLCRTYIPSASIHFPIYALFNFDGGSRFPEDLDSQNGYNDCLIGVPLTDTVYHGLLNYRTKPVMVPEPQLVDLDAIEELVETIREELDWAEVGLHIWTVSGV